MKGNDEELLAKPDKEIKKRREIEVKTEMREKITKDIITPAPPAKVPTPTEREQEMKIITGRKPIIVNTDPTPAPSIPADNFLKIDAPAKKKKKKYKKKKKVKKVKKVKKYIIN